MVDQDLLTEKPPAEQYPQDLSFIERHNINPVVFVGISLIGIFLLYQFVGGGITFLLIGLRPTAENAVAHRLMTMAGQIVFMFVPTIILTQFLTTRFRTFFQWRVPNFTETLLALCAILALQQMSNIYLEFQSKIPLPEELQQTLESTRKLLENMFNVLVHASSIHELLGVLFVVAFIPSIVEELLFRGFVQGGIAKVVTPLRAAVVTGLLFACSHLDPISFIPLVGLGIFFGILKMRSKSIILPMTLHFFNNALAVMVLYFSPHGTLDSFQPENPISSSSILLGQLLLFTFLFMFCIVAYWRFTAPLHIQEPHKQ
jgi:hypothetical protein